MKKILIVFAGLVLMLPVAGCKSANSNSARQMLNPEPMVSDGFPGSGYKRGNPVRNAFNTFSY